MRLLIVTAANEAYASLLKGLVESLHQWGPLKRAELGVLDLDLSPETLKWLHGYTDNIVRPGWDLALDRTVAKEKPHLRAMTSRPFLPRHFPGYDMYLWLDADTWVQQWFPIDWLVQAAGTGKMAIVPQSDRCYQQRPDALQWRTSRLREYFGEFPMETMVVEPYVNSGVFALNADAPHWELWGKWFKTGLDNAKGAFATDQTALNFMLWQERLPIYPLPARCNWTCHLALPEYRMSDGLFHEPLIPGDPIGIMHLTFRIKDLTMPVRGPDGQTVPVNLRFDPKRAKPAVR